MIRRLLVAVCLLFPISTYAQSDCDEACQGALSAVREATAVYHQEINALADGFHPDPLCVSAPFGAMGIHYVNPARAGNPAVDVTKPEVLLYEPQRDGKRRLVAVEYLVPVFSDGLPWFGGADQPPPVIDNPNPVLFGQTFDGPMAGHSPTMPWHYDLHVWVWRHNPLGMFTQFNPKVQCQ